MIQVHVDLAVDPAKEQEMLQYFETEFRPAALQFNGFIEVGMLSLRTALMGSAPPGINYRFALTYESEELRQKWIAADIHQKVWGHMESMLTSMDYNVLLFDVAAARSVVTDTAR
ncbi:MAG: hypothetical protein ABJC09_04715 [Terriglobia bacterium]